MIRLRSVTSDLANLPLQHLQECNDSTIAATRIDISRNAHLHALTSYSATQTRASHRYRGLPWLTLQVKNRLSMATILLAIASTVLVVKTVLVADNICDRHGFGSIVGRMVACWECVCHSPKLSTISRTISHSSASKFRYDETVCHWRRTICIPWDRLLH